MKFVEVSTKPDEEWGEEGHSARRKGGHLECFRRTNNCNVATKSTLLVVLIPSYITL